MPGGGIRGYPDRVANGQGRPGRCEGWPHGEVDALDSHGVHGSNRFGGDSLLDCVVSLMVEARLRGRK